MNDTLISKDSLTETHTYFNRVDYKNWVNKKDSGIYTDGRKNKFWIEYTIDTSIMMDKSNIINDPKRKDVFKPEIAKLAGNYANGKKHGKWNCYKTYYFGNTELWYLDNETEYDNDEKSGFEIHYSFAKDTTYIVKNRNGQPYEMIQFENNKRSKIIK